MLEGIGMKTEMVYETGNSITADMVEALLMSNDIVYERRNFGAGTHLTMVFGSSKHSPIQFHVPVDQAEKAVEILQGAGYTPIES